MLEEYFLKENGRIDPTTLDLRNLDINSPELHSICDALENNFAVLSVWANFGPSVGDSAEEKSKRNTDFSDKLVQKLFFLIDRNRKYHVIKQLKQNDVTLTQVDLSYTIEIKYPTKSPLYQLYLLNDTEFQLLIDALKTNTHLKVLSINNVVEIEPETLLKFASVLKQTAIEVLYCFGTIPDNLLGKFKDQAQLNSRFIQLSFADNYMFYYQKNADIQTSIIDQCKTINDLKKCVLAYGYIPGERRIYLPQEINSLIEVDSVDSRVKSLATLPKAFGLRARAIELILEEIESRKEKFEEEKKEGLTNEKNFYLKKIKEKIFRGENTYLVGDYIAELPDKDAEDLDFIYKQDVLFLFEESIKQCNTFTKLQQFFIQYQRIIPAHSRYYTQEEIHEKIERVKNKEAEPKIIPNYGNLRNIVKSLLTQKKRTINDGNEVEDQDEKSDEDDLSPRLKQQHL
jgi:hypothetical protein